MGEAKVISKFSYRIYMLLKISFIYIGLRGPQSQYTQKPVKSNSYEKMIILHIQKLLFLVEQKNLCIHTNF